MLAKTEIVPWKKGRLYSGCCKILMRLTVTSEAVTGMKVLLSVIKKLFFMFIFLCYLK